jgi:hypothetical protein
MIKQRLVNFNTIERASSEVTPRAGLILFDGFMKAMKVDKMMEKHMLVPGSNRGHKAWEYIRPISLMQYGGGRHIADLREIREDGTLRRATAMQLVPSDSGAGDWLKQAGSGEGLKKMTVVHRQLVRKMLILDNTKEYTLWADPTIIDLVDKAYAQMTYTGVRGDRPILVGLKELPIFVHHKYRCGNAMGGTTEALQVGFEAVESAGKKIKHVAADSELYTEGNVNYIRYKGATFTIVADKDAAVMEVIRHIPAEGWKPFYDKNGVKTDREIAVTIHAMAKTEAFSLVVLRWRKAQPDLFSPDPYCYHAIATDLKVDAACVIEVHRESVPDPCKAVWKYNQRAQMENMLKELKGGFGAEHMPCGSFEANAMYFFISVLTYNLTVAQKYLVIQEGLQRSTIATLRWKLLQVPAWIARHGNRVCLKIATTMEKFNHYLRMLNRIEAIAAWP